MYIIRILGWWIIRGLASLVGGVESIVNDLMSHINFFESAEVTGFMSAISPIIWSLLLIGIVVLGYNLMFNRSEKKSQIPINLLCFVLIITGLPTFLSQISSVTTMGIQTFQGSNSVSSQILKSCVQDLSYYDENDFSVEALQQKNNIAEKKIEKIDPATLMKPKDCKNDDVFKNQISFNTDGTETLTKLSDGLFGWDAMSSYYYRYKIDWLAIYISLIAMFLALLFAAIKTGKIIFEIGFNGIFLLFVAPLDLTVGQRLKKCVMELLSLFLVLICMCLVVRVYVFGVAWVSDTFEGLSKAICLLGFSWGMIDAPNIIQKILGIDAGLSSGFKTMASIYYASRTAFGATKGAASIAKKTAVAGAAVTSYTAGTAKGVYDYRKNKENKQNTSNQDKNKGNLSSLNMQNDSNNHKLLPEKQSNLPVEKPKGIVGYQSKHDEPNPKNENSELNPSFDQDNNTGIPFAEKSTAKGEKENQVIPENKKGRQRDQTTTLSDLMKSKTNKKLGFIYNAYDIGRNTALKNLDNRDVMMKKISDYIKPERPYSDEVYSIPLVLDEKEYDNNDVNVDDMQALPYNISATERKDHDKN